MNEKEKQRAKEVLLEIVRNSLANTMRGKVRFYKTFYYAHLYYAKEGFGVLSDWPIVRMPMGPGVHDFDLLIKELEKEGTITVGSYDTGPHTGIMFQAEDGESTLDENCQKAIRDAVTFTFGRSSTELSDITHEYSLSWNETPDGEELNIYRDVILNETPEQKAKTDAIKLAFS